jgi:hypothetical protein
VDTGPKEDGETVLVSGDGRKGQDEILLEKLGARRDD